LGGLGRGAGGGCRYSESTKYLGMYSVGIGGTEASTGKSV
jgi:hypothetical protein